MSDKITMFTVPRYFEDPFKLIQYNAIRSWLLLEPQPEIILCGNEKGVSEVASELGVKHIPNVKVTNKGTPLLNDVFNKAQKLTTSNIVTYINTDIIVMNNFLDAIYEVNSNFHQFMIVGQRWDLDVKNYIDFSNSFWEKELREMVSKHGKLHNPSGIDYHVFEKGYGIDMHPFVVGRPTWDNWFVYQAHQDGLKVVDATEKILIIHQNHDYSHMAGGFWDCRDGEEAQINYKLTGSNHHDITSANWKFLNGKLIRK